MRCSICGEPWDLDSLHDAIAEQYESEHGITIREALTRSDKVPDGYGYVSIRRDGTWFDQPRYEAEFFNPMVARFRKKGCRAIEPSASYCVSDERTVNRQMLNSVVTELMGDDIDGAISFMEDMSL